MKKSSQKIVLVALFLLTNVCYSQTFNQSYADVANKVTQTSITDNLKKFESLGVKERGSAELTNTLKWLREKYTGFGYSTAQFQEQTFNNGGAQDVNLIITKIGTVYPNKYVLISAHYDSKKGTGTNDNGSGTSVILEVAKLLQKIPTEYSIKFIHFSGEENGLVGSSAYVSKIVNGTSPKMDIKLVFNIDQVGGVTGKKNDIVFCDQDRSTPTSNDAAAIKATNELAKCVQLYSPLKTDFDKAEDTDYIPFQNNGEIITGLFEYNRTELSHTANDLLKNMDPVYVYNIAKATVGATLHFTVPSKTLGIENYETDFQVSIFPSPAKDFININKGILTENGYQFTLIDINGRVALEKNISNASLLEKINLDNVSSGMYLGVIKAGDKKITKKIVIE
jgi:aminopeptidase YwaD